VHAQVLLYSLETITTKQIEDLTAIMKLAKDWNTGWIRDDTESLLSLYTNDPILMTQGKSAVIGKNTIRPLYHFLFEEFTVKGKGKCKVVEFEVSGDLGYFLSSYTLTATPKAGTNQIKINGKSVFIVRRQADNSWKIARLIDNSDIEESVG
jgi:uncharacterized protein (TIGR02246 family)